MYVFFFVSFVLEMYRFCLFVLCFDVSDVWGVVMLLVGLCWCGLVGRGFCGVVLGDMWFYFVLVMVDYLISGGMFYVLDDGFMV